MKRSRLRRRDIGRIAALELAKTEAKVVVAGRPESEGQALVKANENGVRRGPVGQNRRPKTAAGQVPFCVFGPGACPHQSDRDGGEGARRPLPTGEDSDGCSFPCSEDTLATVRVAMLAGLPNTALRDAIFIYPTLPEGVIPLFAIVPSAAN